MPQSPLPSLLRLIMSTRELTDWITRMCCCRHLLLQTQTPKEFWNVGPGEQANSEEALAKGAKPGQVHFFPAIGRVDQLKEGFVKHGCAKL